MSTTNLFNQLKKSIPEGDWPWVYSALRQDETTWQNLEQDVLLNQVILHASEGISLWSPGRLALLTLGSTLHPGDLHTHPLKPLEKGLRQKAYHAYEALTKLKSSTAEKEEESEVIPTPPDLPQAGLLALALRERLRLIGSWTDFPQELLSRVGISTPFWRTPLACLYTYVPDPHELLKAFIRPNASQAEIALAMHILLSNPMPNEEREPILQVLAMHLMNHPGKTWGDLGRLVHELSNIRPDLAKSLALWILSQEEVRQLQETAQYPAQTLIWLAEIYTHAGQAEAALSLIRREKTNTRRLEANLAALWASIAEATEDSAEKDHPAGAILKAWEEAVSLSLNGEQNKNSPFLPYLINAQVQMGEPSRRKKLINRLTSKDHEEASTDSSHPDFLLTIAQTSYHLGDLPSAHAHAVLALKALTHKKVIEPTPYLPQLHNRLSQQLAELRRKLAFFLFDLGSFKECEEAARLTLENSPNDIDMLILTGKCCLESGKPHDAIQALQAAAMLSPENLEVHVKLAEALESERDWPNALQERQTVASRASSENPALLKAAWLKLASCAIQANQPADTRYACDQILNLDPEEGTAYALLGQAALLEKDFAASQDAFTQAVHYAPDLSDAWMGLVNTQTAIGKVDQALETLKEAQQAVPMAYDIHFALGEALLNQGALTQAQQALQKAYELIPADPEKTIGRPQPEVVAYSLSNVLRQLGHTDEARDVLAKAFSTYPQAKKHPDLAYAYAKSLLEAGQTCEAIPVLSEVLARKPEDAKPYVDYAKILLTSREKPEEALQALQHVLTVDPCYDEAQALLGEAFEFTGDNPNALRAYQAALETDLAGEPIWFARLSAGIGRSALALGQTEAAIAALEEAVQAQPNNPAYHRLLSEAYWEANLYNNAFQSARAVLSLDSKNTDSLIWFAEKALHYHQSILNLDADKEIVIVNEDYQVNSPQSIKPKQLLLEALNALVQADQLEPGRADLLVRMAELQILAGESKTALESLRQVLFIEDATIPNLTNAADLYIKLQQGDGAIACLERALVKTKQDGETIPGKLLRDLSQAYILTGNSVKALDTWQMAIDADPQDASLILHLADMLEELHQPDEALARLNEALDHLSDPQSHLQIHFHAALLCRRQGKSRLALTHMKQALSIEESLQLDKDAMSPQWLERHSLAAELAMALLDFGLAHRFLEADLPAFSSQNLVSPLDPDTKKTVLGFYCLKAELALEAGEEVEAANALTRAIQADPQHPRALALQTRFQYRQNDENLALATFKEALDSIDKALPVPQDLGGLAEAACDLGTWDQANRLGELASKTQPETPYWGFNLARILILRAERQHLCDALNVINHSPGKESIAKRSQDLCLSSLSSAEKLLTIEDLPAGEFTDAITKISEAATSLLKIWAARGQAAFDTTLNEDVEAKSSESKQIQPIDWTAPENQPDFLAAYLAYQIRRLEYSENVDLTQEEIASLAKEAAQHYPHHPLVLVNASLALSKVDNPEAQRLAQKASNLVISSNKTLYTLSQGLLAKIEYGTRDNQLAIQAIHAALNIWPDEPRWHSLAAEICLLDKNDQMSLDKDGSEALKHLETAIQLEPNYMPHHLALGKTILAISHEDAASRRHAIEAFEAACDLNPESPEPWLSLAEIYLQEGGRGFQKASCFASRAIDLVKEKHDQTYIKACHIAGNAALELGDPEEALELADQALQASPENLDLVLIKAQALDDLMQPDQALNWLSQASTPLQDNFIFQLKKADLILKEQGAAAALRILNPLLEENPEEPKILAQMAKVLEEAGKTEAASQAAQFALQANSMNSGQYALEINEKADIHHLVGKISGDTGQLDSAIFHLSEAIRIRPNDVEPYLELGETYQKQRQFLKAQKIYEQATTVAPYDPRPFIHAGLALKEGKDYGTAELMFKRAVQLAPNDVQVRKHLAAIAALNLVHNPHNRPTAERY